MIAESSKRLRRGCGGRSGVGMPPMQERAVVHPLHSHDAPFALRLFGSACCIDGPALVGGRGRPSAISGNSRAAVRAVTGTVTESEAQMPDEETRERILRRYASIKAGWRWRRATARLKQFAWIALISGASAAKRVIDMVAHLFCWWHSRRYC